MDELDDKVLEGAAQEPALESSPTEEASEENGDRTVYEESELPEPTEIEAASPPPTKRTGKRRDGRLPISIIGALVGMLVGTVPSALVYALTGDIASLPFIAIPLLICCGILVFKGCYDLRALILTIIFTVIGALLIPPICSAVEYVMYYDLFFLNVPLVTMLTLGEASIWFSFSLNADYVFSLLFMILGVCVSWEIFRYRKTKRADRESASDVIA